MTLSSMEFNDMIHREQKAVKKAEAKLEAKYKELLIASREVRKMLFSINCTSSQCAILFRLEKSIVALESKQCKHE